MGEVRSSNRRRTSSMSRATSPTRSGPATSTSRRIANWAISRPSSPSKRSSASGGCAHRKGAGVGMNAVTDHKPLLTHEVGSLDKPGWRVKAYAGNPLDDKDLEEARSWGERLHGPEYERLLDLLHHAPVRKEQKAELQRRS